MRYHLFKAQDSIPSEGDQRVADARVRPRLAGAGVKAAQKSSK